MLNFPNYMRFCSLHDNLRLVDQQREGRSNLYSLCIYAIKRPFVIFEIGHFKLGIGVLNTKS